MTEPNATAMQQRIEEESIEHVLVEFADVNGISRSKTVAADYFLDSWEDGFPINLLLLFQTPRNSLPTGSGYGEEIEYGDGTLHPDPSTFRVLPWRQNTARVICDIEYESEPVVASPRNVLKRVLNNCDLVLDFYVGSELEFYLLDSMEGEYEPATTDQHECVSWATEEVSPFYDRLSEWADAYGVDLTSLQHEHGAGQLEILFDYGTPLAQADTTFDFKRVVKQAASACDQWATFMAKPFGDRAGSGYHLHVSAFDGDENAFTTRGEGLSDEGKYFLGGLLAHADSLAAFQTPTLNAFKRYDPEGFAPYTASWGFDNRMVSLRIPQGTTRIENRIGSADANPYLVIASTLAAGIDGIRKQIVPDDPVTGNPAGERPLLPQTPEAALQALEENEVFGEMLGDRLVQAYVASKRRELQDFNESVTEWEREQYLETL
ncbi:glutamine synthetase family protein [Haloarcula sp. JP-L23]|uniref:glutamine synthetase family protein n=1 Tax=Haloarcula sp. JP-L23 TaxID=2716717 RepID=UPI00140F2C8D|nr:glutamine synthetase [Haloarcula sp. JP-L23]